MGKLGHDVVLAEDGRDGIDHFGRCDPDLVLLDVMMPGIDGYETARAIRAARDEWIPIIFLSCRAESSDVEAGIEAGADDYLIKPVDLRVAVAERQVERTVGASTRITTSVGVDTEMPSPQSNPASQLARADSALYRAK